MRATPESPRMFQSDFLDFFSRTPWWTVPLVWGPLSTGAVAYGVLGRGVPALGASGVAALALIFWSLAEYGLHRTLFHWRPAAPWGARFHFLLHGVHHDWPEDRYRLVMPPAVNLGLGALVFVGLRAALGPDWSWPAFGGFTLGYMIYDCTHYHLHHGRPRTRYGLRLRAHHMNHHFNHPDRRFGVSSTVWDRVFGTM